VTRGRGNARSSAAAGTRRGAQDAGRPSGTGRRADVSSDDAEIDWERVTLFGSGIALGAALGAGVALLFAPHSGEDTRAAIWKQGEKLAGRSRGAWDELRDELEWAARRGKRRLGRRVQRARWAAEDFIDDRRRPDGWRRKRSSDAKRRPSAEVDEESVEEIVESLC
jgi:hypothetical protein